MDISWFSALLKSIIVLLVVVDPFVSAAFFVSFARSSTPKQRSKAIWTAITVAGGLLLLFIFSGLFLLKILGISFNGFKIAGGLILFALGATIVLGIDIGNTQKSGNIKSAAILIGTPLLSGPGALATAIALSKDYGYIIPAIATIVVIIISYAILKGAFFIHKFVGNQILEVISKVLGLLLAALAVDYIYAGIVGFLTAG
ncbi:MarC family protein [Candidatus Woesearchaeota archaeon]|nr:MarC family protein [Candidatus Woesearchaeota archaeon]